MPSRRRRYELTGLQSSSDHFVCHERKAFLLGEGVRTLDHTLVVMYSTLKQTCRTDFPLGAYCVQRSDDSRVLQFALLIAVRCVLPRYENRDIHR